MTTHTRYKLKIGKFGYYFYDSIRNIKMTLEMVLNRLNSYEIKTNKQYTKLSNLKKEISTANVFIKQLEKEPLKDVIKYHKEHYTENVK